MSLADQITEMSKRLDEAVDGVMAEQIGTNGRLDDLDFQLREMNDMLTLVLSLLQPEES